MPTGGSRLAQIAAAILFTVFLAVCIGDRGTEVACACECDCHADPVCEGGTNVLDVVKVVNVAFRNAETIADPNPLCPYTTTDVDCSGITDVNDAVRIIDVAFRGGDPSVCFCDPCP